LHDNDALTECLYVHADIATRTEDYDALSGIAHALQRIDDESPHPMRQAKICGYEATVAVRRQDMSRALSLLQRGFEANIVAGDRRGEAMVRRLLGVVLADQNRYAEATAQLSDADLLFQMLGDAEGVAVIAHTKAFIFARIGKWEEATKQAELALRLFEPLRVPQRGAACYLNLAAYHTRLGRLQEASMAGNRALRLATSLKNQSIRMLAHSNMASVRHRLGDLRSAIRHAAAAASIARRLGRRDLLRHSLAMRAALHLRLGDKARATRDLKAAIVTSDEVESDAFHPYATLWLIALVKRSLGDVADATEFAARAYHMMGQVTSAMQGEDALASFAGMALNQEIVAAVERDTWQSLELTQAY
jgi:tetratricopeptide (TPR) repeat protein